jgi:tRNA-specific 2-thiouridylase
VLSIEPVSGTVTVGTAEQLDVTRIAAQKVVFPGGDRPAFPVHGRVQVRAHGETTAVTADLDPRGALRLRLDAAIRGVAPGQTAVLYDPSDTQVLAAGTIVSTGRHDG